MLFKKVCVLALLYCKLDESPQCYTFRGMWRIFLRIWFNLQVSKTLASSSEQLPSMTIDIYYLVRAAAFRPLVAQIAAIFDRLDKPG